jgi:triosephosphate isomerase (TIM)
MKIGCDMGKIIFANWKNKVTTEAEAVTLAQATDAVGLVLCPPHTFLSEVAAVVAHAELCVQDYAPDAKATGARYALIGHTDRRVVGDTDAIVAEKLALAVTDGLIPVLCIGESRAERDSGVTNGVLKRQIKEGLSRLAVLSIESPLVYFAYEPLWAISNGADHEQCSPETAVHRIAYLKEQLLHLGYGVEAKYLYGGSVTSKNAHEYLDNKDIDGLLVGAASVNSEELKKIWHSASKS